ncbi:hypothetical protein LCGC14_2055360, partial [marine sediment metagenome]
EVTTVTEGDNCGCQRPLDFSKFHRHPLGRGSSPMVGWKTLSPLVAR